MTAKKERQERAKRIAIERLHLTKGHVRHATTIKGGILVSLVVFVPDEVIAAHEAAHP